MHPVTTLSNPSLDMTSADRLCDLAVRCASLRKARISVAVVDAAGHLLAFRRMDHCILVAIEVAIGKARTAALIGRPAHVFEGMINQGHPALLSIGSLTPLAGGTPVMKDDRLLGAIGISGDSGDTDELIAIESVQALLAGAL